MKNILLILFASFLLSTISVAQTGTVTQSSSTVEERYGDRIELLGIKFKGPLVLCQVLIAIMMTIAFIQSGVDKIIDRSGNLAFFNEHFSNTPLKSLTSFFLSILTIMELAGGLMCAYGVYYALVHKTTIWIFHGFVVLSLTIIILFSGQRIVKDYVGAADLVPYFILIMLGIMSMY